MRHSRPGHLLGGRDVTNGAAPIEKAARKNLMTDHTLRVYDSAMDLLSNADNPTPIVALRRISGFQHAQVYAKLEWYNPFGSVKDRIASNLVRDAIDRGEELHNLVEPTSGNTGLGLAMVSNAHQFGFSAVMSKAVPEEKRLALRLFGADVVELEDDLCPMPGQPEGAMQRAAELGQRPQWRELNQYANPANPQAHYLTTGPEIWRQTQGKITHFVASLGTCGTITGTGRYLKEHNPNVQVIGVHPTDGHDIPGVRSRRALALTDFFLPEEYDQVLELDDAAAYDMCRRLFTEESLTPGPSSGLALAGALQAVPDEPGVVAVVMFPDQAFKYVTSFRRHLPDLFPPADDGITTADLNPLTVHLENAIEMAQNSSETISVTEALAAMRAGAVLLDVRTDAEVEQAALSPSVHLELADISDGSLAGLPSDKDTPIVALCASGVRSLYAQMLLKAQGYSNVKNIGGGINDWLAQGLPSEVSSEPASSLT